MQVKCLNINPQPIAKSMQGYRIPSRKGRTPANRGNALRTKEVPLSIPEGSYEPAPFSMLVQKAPIANVPQRRRAGNSLAIMPNRHVIERALYRSIENRSYSSFKSNLDKATLTTTIGVLDTSFLLAFRNDQGRPLLHVAAAVLGKHEDSRFLK